MPRHCSDSQANSQALSYYKPQSPTIEKARNHGLFHGYWPKTTSSSGLAGWLVVTVGWRGLFFWFTLPGLMVAVLLAIWLPRTEPPAPAARAARSGWSEALGAGPTWLAFAAYLCFNIAFWGFIGWMPSYLNATRHIALAQLGIVAALPYFCGFLGT